MVPSDEVKRIGLYRRPTCEQHKPIKQFTNSLLFQSTKPSLFLLQAYFYTFYFQTPKSLSSSRSPSLLEPCLLHTWKPWHGKFTVVRVKRELNYILLVWTDYQNEQSKKKIFQPLMELYRISVIFHQVMKEARNSEPTQPSETSSQSDKLRKPIPVFIFTTVFVSELFVLDALMYYTPQSIKI